MKKILYIVTAAVALGAFAAPALAGGPHHHHRHGGPRVAVGFYAPAPVYPVYRPVYRPVYPAYVPAYPVYPAYPSYGFGYSSPGFSFSIGR